jgi:hypothetical protein
MKLFNGRTVVLGIVITFGALILIAGVLWLRPWIDDHSRPYE